MVSYRFMVWLGISIYVVLLLFTWLDYSMKLTGYMTLEGAIGYTVLAPVATVAGFKIHQIKSLKIWRFFWTICGALIIGFILYGIVNLLLYRILSLPAWVEMNADLRTVLTMPISYVIGAYVGYRLGKRREFKPPLLYH